MVEPPAERWSDVATGGGRLGEVGGDATTDRMGVAPTSAMLGGVKVDETDFARGVSGEGETGGEGVALRGRALGVVGSGGVSGRGYAGGYVVAACDFMTDISSPRSAP